MAEQKLLTPEQKEKELAIEVQYKKEYIATDLGTFVIGMDGRAKTACFPAERKGTRAPI